MHVGLRCPFVTFVNYTLSSYPDESWYKPAFDAARYGRARRAFGTPRFFSESNKSTGNFPRRSSIATTPTWTGWRSAPSTCGAGTPRGPHEEGIRHRDREPRVEMSDFPLTINAILRHGRLVAIDTPAALRASLPHARFAVIADGGHSPHSERATADAVTRIAQAFLRGF